MSLFMKNVKKIIRKLKLRRLVKNKEKQFKYKGSRLKYMFFPNKDSDMLLIVFSAFSKTGRPASYNYIETFNDKKINRLYILDDFGPDIRGSSYYLGENRNFFVEEMVIKLIDYIKKENSISSQKTLTAGTSKGGFAALYFALKLKLGYAIVGAPQTKLGQYLKEFPKYLEYISGGTGENDIEFLDSILYNEDFYNNEIVTKIYFHVSKNEHHYEDHALPFFDILDRKNAIYIKDINEYKSHGEVGKYYKDFSLNALREIMIL